MSTTTAAGITPGEDRILLSNISWKFYERFCDELNGGHVRLTFNQGCLEIMVAHRPHEFFKKMLARMVEQILFHFNIPVASGGSMTFQREDLQKGFEPNECWWIANEAVVRGRRELDFPSEPPPDLAIEVEITNSLVGRLGIYESLGVRELWRYDGRNLRFLALGDDARYQEVPCSRAFPFLRPAHVEQFLQLDADKDETTRIREFDAWLETQRFEA